MRSALLAFAVVSVLAPCVAVAQPRITDRAFEDENVRRCAYIGYCGSFTLIGDSGTAAYKIGNNRYIADIEFEKEDEKWWVYRIRGNSDGTTKGWAFSRHPHCGKYRVLRYSNGAWRLFDRSDAWGIGLGESFGESTAEVRTTGPSNQELLDTLRRIESRLDDIQPGGRPSLQELEKQIEDRL